MLVQHSVPACENKQGACWVSYLCVLLRRSSGEDADFAEEPNTPDSPAADDKAQKVGCLPISCVGAKH